MYGVFSVPWSRNMVGEERYQHFLSLAGGDEQIAPSLIAFDDDLCHGLQRDLRRIELMLRNGYDRTMRMLWPSKAHDRSGRLLREVWAAPPQRVSSAAGRASSATVTG